MPKTPTNSSTAPRVGIISLGCPKNLVDSELLMGRLAAAGCIVCDHLDDAQIIILNTCGFIQDAKDESLDLFFRCAEQKRQGHLDKIIVTGCLAQRYQADLAKELVEADAVLGLHSEDEIVRLCTGQAGCHATPRLRLTAPRLRLTTPRLRLTAPRLRLTAPHFAYVRIADGCDNRCAYCAIPDIRGPFHSMPMEQVLADAQAVAAGGARELCLIAQDTTRYGEDIYGRQRLHELLPRIAAIDSVQWVRLLYTHPAHFYPELIETLADTPKVVPYVDLPVQHASDKILAAMRRRVTQADLRSLIERIRGRLPNCFIRTALIVGFPGEGDADFQQLMQFVEDMRFERLGAFTYSNEDDTPAADFDEQVPQDVRDERLDAIMTLQQQIAFEFNESLIGQTLPCVIDAPGDEPDLWVGRTHGDAPDVDGNVFVRDAQLRPADFASLRIVGTKDYDLVGERA